MCETLRAQLAAANGMVLYWQAMVIAISTQMAALNCNPGTGGGVG